MVEGFSSYFNNNTKAPDGTSTVITGNHSCGDEFVLLEDIGDLFANTILVLSEERDVDEVFSIGSGLATVCLLNEDSGKTYNFSGSTHYIQKMFNDVVLSKENNEESTDEPIIKEHTIREIVIGGAGKKGVPGEIGDIGPQGLQGERGFIGEQGPQGDVGLQGPEGERGSIGEQGTQGDVGSPGPEGERGFIGEQGTQGERGFIGEQGTQGDAGPQGSQGERGFIGEQGSQGLQGHQGTQGERGFIGEQGEHGFIGEQGPQGTQGTQGTQGDAGPQGPVGKQGKQGTIGPKGKPADITEINVGRGLKFNKKKKELWLDPKTFPPVPIGQIGGAVIGGGGSNTGVMTEGTKVRDTVRFFDFGEDFVITKKKRSESVTVELSSSDANSVQKSGGNNAMTQALNMSDNEITNVKIDGGSFS